MNLFVYLTIFIIGTLFGSFFSLAIYRIPLKKDITHERSFCPKCNHRLEFFDLIPVLSYIFLRGKCRYCGEKVRIRYLVLELTSGFVFLFAFMSLNLNITNIDFSRLIYFLSFIFMYITIALIIGIDKEYRVINKSVLLFGLIMQIIYILYLYIVEGANIYRYNIYVMIMIIFIIIDMYIQKKNKKGNYILQIIAFSIYISLCVGSSLFCIIGIISIIEIIVFNIIKNIKNNSNKQTDILKKNENIKTYIGFFIGITTIIIGIIENFFIFVF